MIEIILMNELSSFVLFDSKALEYAKIQVKYRPVGFNKDSSHRSDYNDQDENNDDGERF